MMSGWSHGYVVDCRGAVVRCRGSVPVVVVEMEAMVNLIEALSKVAQLQHQQQQGPCTCIYCMLYRANWIENVEVEVEEARFLDPDNNLTTVATHHFLVEHSYPKGINIRKWISDMISRCAPDGANWTLTTKTIPHGSKRGQRNE